MSDALLVTAGALALTAAVLLGRSAAPRPVPTAELVALGVLTEAQARLHCDGLPLEEARAIPDDCAKRCTFNVAREFPLVCDCPGG